MCARRALDEHYIQRSRNIWWTVFVLDRQMSVLMGLPLSVNDEDISVPLPSFLDSTRKGFTVAIHVKLCQVLAQVVNSKCAKPSLDQDSKC